VTRRGQLSFVYSTDAQTVPGLTKIRSMFSIIYLDWGKPGWYNAAQKDTGVT
jgi:hypothetical protein